MKSITLNAPYLVGDQKLIYPMIGTSAPKCVTLIIWILGIQSIYTEEDWLYCRLSKKVRTWTHRLMTKMSYSVTVTVDSIWISDEKNEPVKMFLVKCLHFLWLFRKLRCGPYDMVTKRFWYTDHVWNLVHRSMYEILQNYDAVRLVIPSSFVAGHLESVIWSKSAKVDYEIAVHFSPDT